MPQARPILVQGSNGVRGDIAFQLNDSARTTLRTASEFKGDIVAESEAAVQELLDEVYPAAIRLQNDLVSERFLRRRSGISRRVSLAARGKGSSILPLPVDHALDEVTETPVIPLEGSDAEGKTDAECQDPPSIDDDDSGLSRAAVRCLHQVAMQLAMRSLQLRLVYFPLCPWLFEGSGAEGQMGWGSSSAGEIPPLT